MTKEAVFARQEARMDAMMRAVSDRLNLPFLDEGTGYCVENGQKVRLYRGRFTLSIVVEWKKTGDTFEEAADAALAVKATTRGGDTDPDATHSIRLVFGDDGHDNSYGFEELANVQRAMTTLVELASLMEKAAIAFNNA